MIWGFFYAKIHALFYEIHNLISFKYQIDNSIDFAKNQLLFSLIFISLLALKTILFSFTNKNRNFCLL
ncbi:hypothetical protein CLV55_101288 [Flavobacterium aciduliphilum]|uniref:Uncharacterized protein n=1 Tax=Flavobacterium aciduliphilum TaxID=1101402 RepID=A0A328YNB4_9FLAO|nr:hypothetical protein CLV55_101288 [Flavobacterium aciduliphilum]